MKNQNLGEKLNRREFSLIRMITAIITLGPCILASAESITTNTLAQARPQQKQELQFEGTITWGKNPIPLVGQSKFVELRSIGFKTVPYINRKRIDIYYHFLDDRIEGLLFTAEFFDEQGALLGKRLIYEKHIRPVSDETTGKRLWDPPLRNGVAEIHLTQDLLNATSYRVKIGPVWPQEEDKVLNDIRNYYRK